MVHAFQGMKGILAVIAAAALTATPAFAQGPLVRGDVSGTLGWFNARTAELDRYNNWYSRSLAGEAGLGWYWTDHAKLEIFGGATTEASVYGSASFEQNGQRHYGPTRQWFSTRRISIVQQYQFGDNQWFHPYLGAGVDVVWEQTSRQDEAIFSYDVATRQTRMVRGAISFPESTEVSALPAVAAGFKAYMTPRGFFRTDLRVTFADGPAESVLRFGFGVDF